MLKAIPQGHFFPDSEPFWPWPGRSREGVCVPLHEGWWGGVPLLQDGTVGSRHTQEAGAGSQCEWQAGRLTHDTWTD